MKERNPTNQPTPRPLLLQWGRRGFFATPKKTNEKLFIFSRFQNPESRIWPPASSIQSLEQIFVFFRMLHHFAESAADVFDGMFGRFLAQVEQFLSTVFGGGNKFFSKRPTFYVG